MGIIVVVDGGDDGGGGLVDGLKGVGHQVFRAATIQEALSGVWTRPTAVFVRAPARTSSLTQACQHLRNDQRLERVPVIACGADVAHAEQGFAGGADDFCRLPGDPREVGIRIASAEAHPVPIAPRKDAILIVDDDAFFRRSLAELLRREGYQTLEAASGAEALEVLERSTPALAVIDLFMPGLSGVDLATEIRRHPQWHSLPMVAISGRKSAAEKGIVALLDRLGIHDFIEKRGPSLDTLAAVVDDVLRRGDRRARPPRVSARFLGAFRTAPDQPWISAFISDLGTEGAFLRTLVLPPPPTALELRLDWADGRPPLTCAARTVWIRPRSAAGGVVGMGIQFEDLATSEKEQLHAFVHA